MIAESEIETFRVVTIGDSSVGKTSIVNRFIHGQFRSDEPNTVGALYESYTEEHNGRQIEVQVWDTAGQEQYRSLSPVYFRSAAAAILVFDLTNRTSYENLEGWLTCFRSASGDKNLIFLVGNKTDLVSKRRVSEQEAQDWAKENGCQYYETSAHNATGIPELFSSVAKTLGSQPSVVIPEVAVADRSLRDQDGNTSCC
jgi:small GTP-binding protein